MNVWDIVEDPYPGMPELKWRYYAPGGCIGYCKTKKEAEASVAHLRKRLRLAQRGEFFGDYKLKAGT